MNDRVSSNRTGQKNRKTGHWNPKNRTQIGFSPKKRTKIGFSQEKNLFLPTFIYLTGCQAVKKGGGGGIDSSMTLK